MSDRITTVQSSDNRRPGRGWVTGAGIVLSVALAAGVLAAPAASATPLQSPASGSPNPVAQGSMVTYTFTPSVSVDRNVNPGTIHEKLLETVTNGFVLNPVRFDIAANPAIGTRSATTNKVLCTTTTNIGGSFSCSAPSSLLQLGPNQVAFFFQFSNGPLFPDFSSLFTETVVAPGAFIPPPVVTGVSPPVGLPAGGNTVVVSGQNLAGVLAVHFGATTASVVSDVGTQLTATAPAGSGSVDVTVTTAGGTSATSAADQYRYQSLPVVDSVSPPSGPPAGGTSVTVGGSGFNGVSAVSFGSVPASAFKLVTEGQIQATAPAGSASAPVDITVTTPVGTSTVNPADQYHYVVPPNLAPVAAPACAGATGNTSFVCHVYDELLNRIPTPAESSLFTNELTAGSITRTQVGADVLASAEYRADLVSGYFGSYLHRSPDPTGLGTFTALLSSGATDQFVQAGTLGSPEYLADAGGTSGGFITHLYQDLLGRTPEPAGLAFWTARLGSPGQTRATIATGILSSLEYRADLVTGYYHAFLARSPDPAGLATGLAALGAGMTDERYVANLLGSTEYFALVR